jgi:creatinine deaminase
LRPDPALSNHPQREKVVRLEDDGRRVQLGGGSMKEGEPPLRTRWDYEVMIGVALEEARSGLAEGGVPIGAALFDTGGAVLGRGRNRRIQDGDPTMHAEVVAFRNAVPRTVYRDTALVTTLAPCWFCSGLVRYFGIGTVVVGDSSSYGREGLVWLQQAGVQLVELRSRACEELLQSFFDAGGDSSWIPAAKPGVGS